MMNSQYVVLRRHRHGKNIYISNHKSHTCCNAECFITANSITEQGVPEIKSGQDPRVWPKAYSNYPRNYHNLTNWSISTFIPETLKVQTVYNGAKQWPGSKWLRVEEHLKSLHEYNLLMFPPYDKQERDLLTPQREWNLYTFWSPTERKHYDAVTKASWASYKDSKRASRKNQVVRRPRPEMTEG